MIPAQLRGVQPEPGPLSWVQGAPCCLGLPIVPHTPDSHSHLILFHDTDLLKVPGFLGRGRQWVAWQKGGLAFPGGPGPVLLPESMSQASTFHPAPPSPLQFV